MLNTPNEYCLVPFVGFTMEPDREPCLPQGFYFFSLFVFCCYTSTKKNPPPQCM